MSGAGRQVLAAAVAAAVAAGFGCSRRQSSPPPPAASRAVEPPPARAFEPPGLAAGEQRPLVILLHGLGSSAEEVLDEPALGSLGARHRVFVVVPDGATDGRGREFWNAGPACCDFEHTGIDDVARLSALVDHWRKRPGVDPRRIYVLGFSNGGFMAHRLACRIGDRLAAVVSIGGAGVADGERCEPPSPVGVLEIHGDGDRIVRPDGGRVFNIPDVAPYLSTEATLTGWAARLGCGAAQAAPAATLDLDARIPGAETAVRGFRECRLGDVELWTVRGGLHAVGTPEMFEEAWRFLDRHAKPEGAEMIGKPAPAWEVRDWINSPPLTLAGLRGKVVLVRWFMSTDCPYCSATAPALNQLDREFRGRGLVVVGMYHHKNREPLDVAQVKGWVGTFGFKFPVAVDRDWRTLNRWWLDAGNRDYTSVSFLVDKQGRIRKIHPGGTLAPRTKDYDAMRAAIEGLLRE